MHNSVLIKIGITLIVGVFIGIVLGTIILITYIIPDYMHVYIPSHDQDTKLWLSLAAFLFTVIGFVIGLAGIISPAMQFFSNKNFLDTQEGEISKTLEKLKKQHDQLTDKLKKLKKLNNAQTQKLLEFQQLQDKQDSTVKKLTFSYANNIRVSELKNLYVVCLLEGDFETSNLYDEKSSSDNQASTMAQSTLAKEHNLQQFESFLLRVSDHNKTEVLDNLRNLLGLSSFFEGEIKEGIADYLCWLYNQGMFDEGENALDLKKTFEALMKDYFGRGNFW